MVMSLSPLRTYRQAGRSQGLEGRPGDKDRGHGPRGRRAPGKTCPSPLVRGARVGLSAVTRSRRTQGAVRLVW